MPVTLAALALDNGVDNGVDNAVAAVAIPLAQTAAVAP